MIVVRFAFDGCQVAGELAPDEDSETLARALTSAREDVLAGRVVPRVHGDLTGVGREVDIARHLSSLETGRLKRYVIPVQSATGPRILKVHEPTGLKGYFRRRLSSSTARQEHRQHQRVERLGIAATRSLGYLEMRDRGGLVRSAQVQTQLDDSLRVTTHALEHHAGVHGIEAYGAFGSKLAAVHALPFFHADLKPYHALTHQVVPGSDYEIRWLDLGRCGFRMSPRRRIINLYQALRFVLPDSAEAQARFVEAYCQASGWRAGNPAGALQRVRRFLDRKLRTHPSP